MSVEKWQWEVETVNTSGCTLKYHHKDNLVKGTPLRLSNDEEHGVACNSIAFGGDGIARPAAVSSET